MNRRTIALPGTDAATGPCKGNCGHQACQVLLATAYKPCIDCDQRIGFGRSFVADPEDDGLHVHTDCLASRRPEDESFRRLVSAAKQMRTDHRPLRKAGFTLAKRAAAATA